MAEAKPETGTRRTMEKTYDPAPVEARWYPFWENGGYFAPRPDAEGEPFTVIMPPPNVTGELHLGHALTAAIEDVLVRWHRMRGDATLWVPGTDHAGIATQVVVERLLQEEGVSRQDLGRTQFEARVWEWVQKYGHIIDDQHRRLGASCDWSRDTFTLDPGPARAVRTTFVRLYHKGLIYRGERITNWCPRCSTALSDLEVAHEEEDGHLWHISYPLADDDSTAITVATTRPETMLGDTAVAVNPDDPRHRHLLGRQVILPLTDRKIPIIADEAVEAEFGAGALKVTPSHDIADFEIGQRHGLEFINVLNLDATMNENAGPAYAGMDRYACRAAVVRELEAQGRLVKIEAHRHAIGHCTRCDIIVEPLVSRQWWLETEPLAKPAIEAVRSGKIRILPEHFTRIYYNWMENIRDWCISRQLWWGHRIPVWYCDACETVAVPPIDDPMRDPEACSACGGALRQDPDVLDTWFSSALWPHSTLGWPDDTADLRQFYPTAVMETGHDILFFWVARMIMMGIENMGDIPFHTVYLHGLIRDLEGQKMSKTRGNVINPLVMVEEYGADALRFALVTGTTAGNDMRFTTERLQAARNFANKLWNATRFVLSNRPEEATTITPEPDASQLSLVDRWIISRRNHTIAEVTRLLDQFHLGEAGRALQEFVWGQYCDWYIEAGKVSLYGDDPRAKAVTQSVLENTLAVILRLLHPFMPFITEEIWHYLHPEGTPDGSGSLIVAPWPVAGERDHEAEDFFSELIEAIRGVRNIRAEYDVEPGRYIPATMVAGAHSEAVTALTAEIELLGRVRPLTVHAALAEKPEEAVSVLTSRLGVYVPLAGLRDVEQERQRLQKEEESVLANLERTRGLLANENFVNRAPPPVVQKEREKLEELELRAQQISERLAGLS